MTVPREIVWAAIEFTRTVRKYSDITDEQVEQMFDAFSPSLKRQVLMSVLNPHGIVRIIDTSLPRNKIGAIKEVRAATGWGLKEAKDFIELAESREGAQIPSTFSYETIEKLARNLDNTGYKVF